jgi:hypothetical protein
MNHSDDIENITPHPQTHFCSDTYIPFQFACTPFDVPHDIVTQKFQTVHVDSLAPFQRTWKTPVRGRATPPPPLVEDSSAR